MWNPQGPIATMTLVVLGFMAHHWWTTGGDLIIEDAIRNHDLRGHLTGVVFLALYPLGGIWIVSGNAGFTIRSVGIALIVTLVVWLVYVVFKRHEISQRPGGR